MIERVDVQAPGQRVPVRIEVDGCQVLYPYRGEHMAEIARSCAEFYERPLLSQIQDLDLKGLYLDLGAHCGNHAVFFARFCPGATALVAVEPARDMVALLRQNLRIHGRAAGIPCYIVEAAVGLDVPWATITRDGSPNTGAARARSPEGRGARWAAPVLSVDTIMSGIRALGTDDPVALIKVDVESCEMATILSARETIERDRPVVVAETVGWRKDGTYIAGSAEDQAAAITGALQQICRGVYARPTAFANNATNWKWMPKG